MPSPKPTTHEQRRQPSCGPYARGYVLALALVAVAGLTGRSGSAMAAGTLDAKPYDERLMRLTEILGAVHYLRELCGAGDGQLWRDRMQDLLNAEGGSALRRMRLTRSFNQGYRAYSRTYIACTPSAQTAITRFLAEGAQISDGLIKSIP